MTYDTNRVLLQWTPGQAVKTLSTHTCTRLAGASWLPTLRACSTVPMVDTNHPQHYAQNINSLGAPCTVKFLFFELQLNLDWNGHIFSHQVLRPRPAFCTASDKKLGGGPGNEGLSRLLYHSKEWRCDMWLYLTFMSHFMKATACSGMEMCRLDKESFTVVQTNLPSCACVHAMV